MYIRYVDNGYFFVNSLGFSEWVDERYINGYKKVRIRDYFEGNININNKNERGE